MWLNLFYSEVILSNFTEKSIMKLFATVLLYLSVLLAFSQTASFTLEGSVFCKGFQTQVNNTSSGTDNTYTWSASGNIIIINPQAENPTIIPNGDGVLMLTLQNGSSFQESISTIDRINIFAAPDAQICFGESVQLETNIIEGPDYGTFNYKWSPENGLSDPNIANPIASPNSFSIYTVEVTNGNCNPSYANVSIEVNNNLSGSLTATPQNGASPLEVNFAFEPDDTSVTHSPILLDSNKNYISTLPTSLTINVNGNHTFYVENDSNNCQFIESIVVNVADVVNSHIENFNSSFSISPNPLTHSSILNLNTEVAFSFDIDLVDYSGRIKRSFNDITSNQIEIEKGELSKGVYLLNIRANESNIVLKTIKLVVF